MIAIKNNSLATLSDSQLLTRLDDLVRKERQTTLEVLRHIIEMDRRRLYLGRGYSSLYEYCTRHLGYSESASFRRIQTARCIRDFPEVYDMLLKNELNLTTVTKLAGILTDENKNALLEAARCKSTRQVEAIVARYNPRGAIRDRVRTVFIKTFQEKPVVKGESKIDGSENNSSQSDLSNQKNSSPNNWGKFTFGAGGKKSCTYRDAHPQKPILEKKFKLEFAVNPDVMKNLEEVKALLSKKYPRGVSFEQLFKVLLEEYLEIHSPKRKDSRRKTRKAKQKDKQKTPSPPRKAWKNNSPANKAQKRVSKDNQPSRHIPAAVRDKVFARDKSRCTYVSSNGDRCNSTWNLQVDHIMPYARGGNHSIRNLRLLCAEHNRHEAERVYGRDFSERRIHRRE